MRLASNTVHVRDSSGLGTMQSTILDVYESVVLSRIFDRPDPVVIDVGANIGQFTNAVKLFYPGARIVAFEPDPDVFLDLQTNTARLGSIDVRNIALGARSGVQTFNRNVLSGMSSFRPVEDPRRLRGTIEVVVEPLDEVIDESVSPDLVKIDVEGYELETLQGATKTLRRTRFLLIELSLNRPSGITNLEVIRALADIAPGARIVRFGRPLGDPVRPEGQDALIDLNSF